jgi:hypothetical protein
MRARNTVVLQGNAPLHQNECPKPPHPSAPRARQPLPPTSNVRQWLQLPWTTRCLVTCSTQRQVRWHPARRFGESTATQHPSSSRIDFGWQTAQRLVSWANWQLQWHVTHKRLACCPLAKELGPSPTWSGGPTHEVISPPPPPHTHTLPHGACALHVCKRTMFAATRARCTIVACCR